MSLQRLLGLILPVVVPEQLTLHAGSGPAVLVRERSARVAREQWGLLENPLFTAVCEALDNSAFNSKI